MADRDINNSTARVSKRKPRRIAPSTENSGQKNSKCPARHFHFTVRYFSVHFLFSSTNPSHSIPLPGNYNPINGHPFNKSRICARTAGKKTKRLAVLQVWREF
jgi:hypothetical protein